MPTLLTATERYISPEVAKVYMVPTIATLATPSRAEMEAAGSWDLTKEVAAMTGWEIRADRVPAPDLGTKFTGRTTGRTNPGDAQISFYASQTTADVRDVMARGDKFNILILDGGDVPGQKGRAFAVEVAALTPSINVEGSENTRIMADFAISAVVEEFTIPALS